jgi:hypothetical protein
MSGCGRSSRSHNPRLPSHIVTRVDAEVPPPRTPVTLCRTRTGGGYADTATTWCRVMAADTVVPIRTPAEGGDDDAVTALLERVIQHIFSAGLLLVRVPGENESSRRVRRALDELDAALNDIHAEASSWVGGSS